MTNPPREQVMLVRLDIDIWEGPELDAFVGLGADLLLTNEQMKDPLANPMLSPAYIDRRPSWWTYDPYPYRGVNDSILDVMATIGQAALGFHLSTTVGWDTIAKQPIPPGMKRPTQWKRLLGEPAMENIVRRIHPYRLLLIENHQMYSDYMVQRTEDMAVARHDAVRQYHEMLELTRSTLGEQYVQQTYPSAAHMGEKCGISCGFRPLSLLPCRWWLLRELKAHDNQ